MPLYGRIAPNARTRRPPAAARREEALDVDDVGAQRGEVPEEPDGGARVPVAPVEASLHAERARELAELVPDVREQPRLGAALTERVAEIEGIVRDAAPAPRLDDGDLHGGRSIPTPPPMARGRAGAARTRPLWRGAGPRAAGRAADSARAGPPSGRAWRARRPG